MGTHGVAMRPRRRVGDRESLLARLFVLPAIGYVLALIALPVGLAVAYALSDVTVGDLSYDWVGMANLKAVVDDPVFWESLGHSLLFTSASTVLAIAGGHLVARLMLARVHGRWLVRLCVLLPWTTPVTLSAVAWLWLFDPVFSPLDWAGRQIGALGPAESVNWLGRPHLAMAAVVAVQAWRLTPLTAVVIMAAMAGIPRCLYEAAQLDGAGRWRRAFFITVPLTAPVSAVAALFCAVFSFTDLAVVRTLTNGGPTYATETLATWAFRKGIDGGDVGYGAAVALFLLPVLLAATLSILATVRRMAAR